MARTKKTTTLKAASKPRLPKKAPSARKKNPSEKAKALSKKATKNNKTIDELNTDDEGDSSDPEIDELADEGNSGTLPVDWSDQVLTQDLIARIIENATIKRALFPPPGPNASTAKGGGKTKSSAYWQLLQGALDAVSTTKDQTAWGNKIKNRLRTMGRTTRDYIEEMGQTGAGISSADQIDTSLDNAFTSKWLIIAEECPWFFEMRELIGQRPNVVPVGLGISETGIDMDVLGGPAQSDGTQDGGDQHWPSNDDDASSEMGFEGRQMVEDITDQSDAGFPPPHELLQPSASSQDTVVVVDEAAATAVDSRKKKQKQKPLARKTAAKDGTSNPAPPPAPTPATSSKKTKLGEFAEIAKSEELTRHKELDLATVRAQQSIKILDMKMSLAEQREQTRCADRQAQREERMAKLRIKETKLQHAHELRMARFRAATAISGTGSLGGSHASHTASFTDQTAGTSYASSDADYSEFGSDLEARLPDLLHTHLLDFPRTTISSLPSRIRSPVPPHPRYFCLLS
ncbi:hypothetical protein K438DRAFT_2086789 [Mycena galopus ATCC 62051]|nr:hypothetical protein K438DRAFT_2086789 [Mycena galopus ATCC 62051]